MHRVKAYRMIQRRAADAQRFLLRLLRHETGSDQDGNLARRDICTPYKFQSPSRRQITWSREILPAPRQSNTSNMAAHWMWVGQACG